MVTLDRVKILTDKKHIKRLDANVTTIVMKNNKHIAIRYNQKKPYNLFINYSIEDSKCIIEFSAKVLQDRYPELINKNNIHDCFKNVNDLGFCEIDIDGIVNDSNSKLLSCDVTTDIDNVSMPDKLVIKACLMKHLNKYQVQKYGNSGHTITKMVKTKNRQIRLSIYDKGRELNKMANAQFLELLQDRNRMHANFNGKFRLEANVKTKIQIKQLFQVNDNNLLDVLNSSANPLLTLFDEVFILPDEPERQIQVKPDPLSLGKLSDVKNALLLEKCDFDMEKVDLVLKTSLSPNTNTRNYKAKLVKLMNTYHQPNQNIKMMKKFREQLSKCGNTDVRNNNIMGGSE
ncbi:MAG: hypothetical protein KAR19_19955 [Bacteroidales bacterium]|nr:hypothetical protein [Bacteroidales bacterium]